MKKVGEVMGIRSDKQPMSHNRRLFLLTKGFRARLWCAAGIGLIASAAGLGRLVLCGHVLALIFKGQPLLSLFLPMSGVLICILIRALSEYIKEVFGNYTAGEIKLVLREKLYGHMLDLGPGYFNRQRTGDVVLAMVEGVEQLETFMGQYFPQLVVAALTPVLIFMVMIWFDLLTALVFVGFALFTLIAPFFFTRWTAASSLKRRDAYSDLGADFLDAVQGLSTLKSFGQSSEYGESLAKRARYLCRSTMGVLAVNIITSGLITLGISAGAGVALGWGALRVSQGTLSLPALLVVLMLGVEVFRPLRELSRLYHRSMIAVSSAKAIFDLLDSVPNVVDHTQSGAYSDAFECLEPELRFEGVGFSYPERPHVLTDVDLVVKPGQRIGLTGPSGAGKSTLIWLLLRFFDPQKGRVLLGGYDIRTLPIKTLRRHFAVVMQDTHLFHGTVADNLRFGKAEATREELEAAARTANAHDFIMTLPQGYDTVVGERGLRLSGGQRQRLAIARAMLKDAPILLLDEALSSVDTENEAQIQEALDRLMVGRTTLIVAHRLSSVIGSDSIAVMESGRIIEMGRHTELIEAEGAYARLMINQMPAPMELRDHQESDKPVVNNIIPDVSDSSKTRMESVSKPSPDRKPIGWLKLWHRLLLLVKSWWLQLGITFFSGVGHIAAVIGIGVTSALIVGRVSDGESFRWLLMLLWTLIPMSAVLHYMESWLAHDLAYRLLTEMRIHIYELLDRLAPAYLFRRRTGDLVSLVTADVETIELFFAHTVAPGFVAVIVPTAVLVALGIIAVPLAVALAPFLLLVGFSPFFFRNRQDRLAGDLRDNLGKLNASMVDGIQGIKEIVSFDHGARHLATIQHHGEALNRARFRFLNNLSFEHALAEALMSFGGLAVLSFGAILVLQGILSARAVPVVTLLAMAAFVPISEIARIGKELSDTMASARRLFAVEDEPIPVRDGKGVPVYSVSKGASAPAVQSAPMIQYDGVSFTYNPDEAPVLRQISFNVAHGRMTALVGRSGSGKTTAVNLMLRYWDVQTGAILIDGRDIRSYKLADLRRQIALVSQDTYLFNTSVMENLRLGKPDASTGDIERAAEQANAHHFIMQLPDKYDTRIGERGMQLSGGQRQRIAIARAILKDAPILLLDEATSQLDAENEHVVHDALLRLMVGRTALVIAHRLSTVRNADKIVVMDDGRIVEQGTHKKLMGQYGVYERLIAAQHTNSSTGNPIQRKSTPFLSSDVVS